MVKSSVGCLRTIFFGLACLPAACTSHPPTNPSSTTTTAPAVRTVSVKVGLPANGTAVLGPGESVQLWAVANYSDGGSVDVTNTALWQSSNPAVAIVSRTGLVTAAAEGVVELRASIENLSGSLQAEIRRRGCESSRLSLDSLIFGPFSSSASVTLTTPMSDCRWTARSDGNWLLFSNGRSTYDPGRSGSGSFTYSVAGNNFPEPRSGQIVVSFTSGGELTHSVVQEQPRSCSYVITPEQLSFPKAGGSGRFNVTTTPPDCRWNATTSYSFYGVVITAGGSGTGAGQVTYNVGANPNVDFVRGATIVVAGLSGTNPSASHTISIAGN